MDFELPTQSVKKNPETEKFREKPSSDYQNIRNEALDMLLMKKNSGALGVEKYKAAEKYFEDDQQIIKFAKENNWELYRAKTEDLEETDKELARKLVMAALSLH